MQQMIIFDFSNLAYLSLFAVTRTPEVLEPGFDGHHRVFVSKVQSILKKMYNNDTEIVFCLDSYPESKHSIYPEYKAGRKKFDFDPKKGLLPALNPIIQFKIAKVKGYEADDLMASLVKQNPDKSIIVVSSDKDLWVLLQYPHCNIYDLNKGDYATHELYVEKFKLQDYKHLTLYKALWGDSSDNIANKMPALQKSMLPVITESDGTLSSFIELFEKKRSTFTKAVTSKFDANLDGIIDNYSIVQLYCNLKVELHNYVPNLEYNL